MQLYRERENMPLVPYESLQVCPLRTAGAQRQGPPLQRTRSVYFSLPLSHTALGKNAWGRLLTVARHGSFAT
jgi:hypothetical protein